MASNERPARATGSRCAEASPVGAPRGQRGPARGGAVSSRRCAAAGGGRALGPCGRSRPLPGAGARPPQLLPRRAPTPARPAPDPGRAPLVLPRRPRPPPPEPAGHRAAPQSPRARAGPPRRRARPSPPARRWGPAQRAGAAGRGVRTPAPPLSPPGANGAAPARAAATRGARAAGKSPAFPPATSGPQVGARPPSRQAVRMRHGEWGACALRGGRRRRAPSGRDVGARWSAGGNEAAPGGRGCRDAARGAAEGTRAQPLENLSANSDLKIVTCHHQ